MTPVRLVLVDDHRVVTRSLKAWLESFADLTVVGIAANGEDLLAHLDTWHPDIVLQDLLMPGGLDGIETTRRIRERWPSIRVIALTASCDEPRMMAALRAGAAGYIRKNSEPEVLLAAVRAVARGETYLDPTVAQSAGSLTSPGLLTPREADVLRHVVAGRSNAEIARQLGVAPETVKTHVSHLLAKLQAENRSQAIAAALRQRLVSIEDLDRV